MAKLPVDPNSLAYWIARGAAKAAQYIHTKSTSGVQVINALVKEFKGIPRKIAGELFSLAHKALNAAYDAGQGIVNTFVPGERIPINPNLFPEGRMGRRFRYEVDIIFNPTSSGKRGFHKGDSFVRTQYVTSSRELTQEQVNAEATKLAFVVFPRSPPAAGKAANIGDYTLDFQIVSVWRSH